MRFERKRGCNLAESFEGIWEFIARTNILVPPPASSRRTVVGNGRTVRAKLTRILDSETSNTSRLITKYKIYHESNKMRIMW